MKSLTNMPILALLFASTGPLAGAVDEFGHDYSKIEILAATYGSGGKQANVKERVIDFMVTNPRRLVVTPRDLGVDPAPGWNKELKVTHVYSGKQRVQRWGENEFAYSISLCVPNTKEELVQWMAGTRWSKPQGLLLFKADGFGVQNAANEPVQWRSSWKWKAVDHRKLLLVWSDSATIMELNLNWKCSELKELSGSKNTFTRLPSLGQTSASGQSAIAIQSTTSAPPVTRTQTPPLVGQQPAPSSPPQSTPGGSPTPQRQLGGIVLDSYWESPLQGGRNAMQELATLLSPFAKPARNTAPSPGLKIFEGVTYLMPYEEARKTLGLNQRMVPKSMIESAGFPRSSLYVYAFDGAFEGHFNKLYLMTDKADQVVGVHLVAGSPKRDLVDAPTKATDWHTYNFVNARAKAIPSLWIGHKQFYQERGQWNEYRPTSSYQQAVQSAGLLRIDSVVIDPNDRRDNGYRDADWRALEAVRWYVPQPLMELILHCIRNANR